MSSADESKDIIRDVKNFFGVSPTTKDGRPKTDAEVKEEYNQKRSLYKEQLRDLVKKERILLNDHPNHRCSSRTLDVFYGFKQSPRNVGSPFKTLMRCLWSKPGAEPDDPIENYIPDERYNRVTLVGDIDSSRTIPSLQLTDRKAKSSESE